MLFRSRISGVGDMLPLASPLSRDFFLEKATSTAAFTPILRTLRQTAFICESAITPFVMSATTTSPANGRLLHAENFVSRDLLTAI